MTSENASGAQFMPLISCEALTKHYVMGKTIIPVLGGVDFSVLPGDTAAIMGPSGSGKSTLLHCLGLLDKPTSGSISYDGIDVSYLSSGGKRKLLAEEFGFVFQSFHLIPELTLEENILMGERARHAFGRVKKDTVERCREIANTLGIGERLSHLPRELSGGEQQRVAIARALTNRPRLLLADEPTGNLDVRTGGEILDVFFRLVRDNNSSLVMVTHNPDVASRCDHVYHIREGRLVTGRELVDEQA